jgi:hypothetical protein
MFDEIKARADKARNVLAKNDRLKYDTEYCPLIESISDIPNLVVTLETLHKEKAKIQQTAIDILFKAERGEEINPCDYCVHSNGSEEECGCEMGDNFEWRGKERNDG